MEKLLSCVRSNQVRVGKITATVIRSLSTVVSGMMENKVVLVTGSSSGIGRSIAIGFARLNCRLVIHGTNESRVQQVIDECHKESPSKLKPIGVIGDFNKYNQDTSNKLINETLLAYKQLDILVNNAGLFKPFHATSENAYECYEEMMRINVNSAVQLSLLAVNYLKKSKGCIINISSNLHAKCIQGGFAYCTAKAALTMFSKTLAVDLAPDVRVNSISPGPVATNMSVRNGMEADSFRKVVGDACLIGRVGEPDEIARLVIFLASPESAFITGTDYIIDGGSTIKPEGKVMGQI